MSLSARQIGIYLSLINKDITPQTSPDTVKIMDVISGSLLLDANGKMANQIPKSIKIMDASCIFFTLNHLVKFLFID